MILVQQVFLVVFEYSIVIRNAVSEKYLLLTKKFHTDEFHIKSISKRIFSKALEIAVIFSLKFFRPKVWRRKKKSLGFHFHLYKLG